MNWSRIHTLRAAGVRKSAQVGPDIFLEQTRHRSKANAQCTAILSSWLGIMMSTFLFHPADFQDQQGNQLAALAGLQSVTPAIGSDFAIPEN